MSAGVARVQVTTVKGIFVSSPNPAIANPQVLLVWLNGVLVEAANQGFSSMGNFQLTGGYLLVARIVDTCVTQLVLLT